MSTVFERFNERRKRPNKFINFIESLKGNGREEAMRILEQVAAVCYPLMKEHGLVVNRLVEHEWNRQFAGRNFNGGEVIELVIRSKNGQWLPIKHVMWVMIHELAHCKHMNHYPAFWEFRGILLRELEGLLKKGYTGEGFWSYGHSLGQGEKIKHLGQLSAEEFPNQVCGGTYSRVSTTKKKRKMISRVGGNDKRRKKCLTKGGKVLGADIVKRFELTGKKGLMGRPRVAGSLRGRDLRALAAEARQTNDSRSKSITNRVNDNEVIQFSSDDDEEVIEFMGLRYRQNNEGGNIEMERQEQDEKNEIIKLE